MKRIAPFLLVVALTAFSIPGLVKDPKPRNAAAPTEETVQKNAGSLPGSDLETKNPIDRAFAKDFEQAQSTPEINAVNEAYLDAWKAEMANAAGLVKKSFTHQEDGKRVDEYLSAYENLGKKAFDLEMLNWLSDPEESIASRSFGTGAPGGAMLAEGKIFRQAALNLIAHYQGAGEREYTFAYKGSGAGLEKLRQK